MQSSGTGKGFLKPGEQNNDEDDDKKWKKDC